MLNASTELLAEKSTGPRERRIGGYDIAAILGLSPYSAPIDVFERIVEGKKKDQTKAMKRGIYLEPAIRQMYVDETGARLQEDQRGIWYSKKYPFMVASVDDLAERNGRLRTVDYKAPHPELERRWGEPGTDEVDQVSLIQAQWYLACLDLRTADVVPYFGGDDLRVYTVHADDELQAMMIEAAAKFWRDHVVTQRPPPPDKTAAYGEYLERKFPASRGNFIEADFDAESWAEQLFLARQQREAADLLEQEARNHLQELIGGADGIEGSTWKISWKTAKGRTATDWEAIAREAGVPEELIQRHTTIGAGYRVFRPTIKKTKKGAQ